ncbi:MAG: DUF4870 domain-containing protein [Porphyromonadaceae bacterium]|nr:MAG: DUF4870 domain-containing protein [Porphyromonadaceae bacterium]
MRICRKCGAQVADGVMAYVPQCGAPMIEPPKTPQQDVEQNKVMAVLAYFGILVFNPDFSEPKNQKFARFHANQGLILLITGVAYSIFVQVVIKIVVFISYALAGIVGIVLGLAWLLLLVLAIIGIINAVKGEFKQLPLIGQFQILKIIPAVNH